MSLYLTLKHHFRSEENNLDMTILEIDLKKEGYLCSSWAHSEGFFIKCKKKSIFSILSASIEMSLFKKENYSLMSITYQALNLFRIIGFLSMVGILIITIIFDPFEVWVKTFKIILWIIYGLSYLLGEELLTRLQSRRFTKIFLRLRNSFKKIQSKEFYSFLNNEGMNLKG